MKRKPELFLVFMEFIIRILHDPNYYHLGNNPATVSFGHAGFFVPKVGVIRSTHMRLNDRLKRLAADLFLQ